MENSIKSRKNYKNFRKKCKKIRKKGLTLLKTVSKYVIICPSIDVHKSTKQQNNKSTKRQTHTFSHLYVLKKRCMGR